VLTASASMAGGGVTGCGASGTGAVGSGSGAGLDLDLKKLNTDKGSQHNCLTDAVSYHSGSRLHTGICAFWSELTHKG
jgi:hypothetical protein